MFLEPGIRPACNPDQNPRTTDVDENPEYKRGNSRCLAFCDFNMALKVFLFHCPSSLVCIPNGIKIPLGKITYFVFVSCDQIFLFCEVWVFFYSSPVGIYAFRNVCFPFGINKQTI